MNPTTAAAEDLQGRFLVLFLVVPSSADDGVRDEAGGAGSTARATDGSIEMEMGMEMRCGENKTRGSE